MFIFPMLKILENTRSKTAKNISKRRWHKVAEIDELNDDSTMRLHGEDVTEVRLSEN